MYLAGSLTSGHCVNIILKNFALYGHYHTSALRGCDSSVIKALFYRSGGCEFKSRYCQKLLLLCPLTHCDLGHNNLFQTFTGRK